MFWQKDASSIHQSFEVNSVLHYTQKDYVLDCQIKEILLKSTFQQNESNICLPSLMLPKRGCNYLSMNYNRSANALAGCVELQGQCWCLSNATSTAAADKQTHVCKQNWKNPFWGFFH